MAPEATGRTSTLFLIPLPSLGGEGELGEGAFLGGYGRELRTLAVVCSDWAYATGIIGLKDLC